MIQKIVRKFALVGTLAVAGILVTPGLAFAHVVVKPSEALTGAYQTFTTSVPNEKDVAVTGIRLVIPESVESVTPTVKPGWKITTKKSGDTITEISWTGGTIPAEQRDDFTFSAHLPSTSGDIVWKAYQTYQDGSVVSWDQKPAEDHGHESEDESKGPYSVTTVKDEATDGAAMTQDGTSNGALYVIGIAALALSAFAVFKAAKK